MKIEILPAAQLNSDQLSAWSRLQRADPSLANPFFRPEFALTVAAERPGVDVAVWTQGGEPVGFLPFERNKSRTGRAVGYYINQFQGVIARPDFVCSPRDFVRAAGLRRWRFDHLSASQQAFAPFQYITNTSPYLDLSQGFEHYHRSRGKSATKFVSHIFQKDRKAGRDLGEVRMEVNSTDRGALLQLLEWKIEQYRRTHMPCVFHLDWVVRLHERLLAQQSEDFSGVLFNLYMGGKLAAGFFSLRSHNLLQGSVLGYDRELGQYAPGFVLLMRVAQMANAMGITRIDMGAGSDEYKEKLASGFEQVTEGTVSSRPLFAPLYRGWFRARDQLRTTALRGPVMRVRRLMLSTAVLLGYGE